MRIHVVALTVALMSLPAGGERTRRAVPDVVKPAKGAKPVEFMGIKTQTKKVVFLCDASGSMIDKFPALKAELTRAVGALAAGQEFAVILFSEDQLAKFEGGTLRRATAANKKKLGKWLEGEEPAGRSAARPAIEAAFATGADTIFLAADDEFRDGDEAAQRAAVLNKDGAVRLHAVIVAADPRDVTDAFPDLHGKARSRPRGRVRRQDHRQSEVARSSQPWRGPHATSGLEPTVGPASCLRYNNPMPEPTVQYRYLVRKPGSSYRQLFVKDRWVRARTLYGMYLSAEEPRTMEEIAADYEIPLEAVREAIEYCRSDPPDLRADFAREEAIMEASGMNDPNYKFNPRPKPLTPQQWAEIDSRFGG